MKKITFFDWTIHLQAELTAITDHPEKKMVILEPSIELNSIIWLDDNNELQIKPTWDCVISIDPTNKSLNPANRRSIRRCVRMKIGGTMKKTTFYDWTVHYPEHLTAVKDDTEKKMVFLEQTIEFKGIIRIDENDELQIKPTWDCVIINAKNMSVTVRNAEDIVGLP